MLQGGLTFHFNRMGVMLMKNQFDFMNVLTFGIFLLALLTFVFTFCNIKNHPSTLAEREGGFSFSNLVNPPCGRLFLLCLYYNMCFQAMQGPTYFSAFNLPR